jgi:glutathione synthase/RimK-type ligase-like ATP-grasp enzyme
MQSGMTSSKWKILFVTTQRPDTIKAEWPRYQNFTLPKVMEEQNAVVSIACWLDESLTSEKIATFDVVTFLWCNNYDDHPRKFENFLSGRLASAQLLAPSLRIINNTAVILWNYNKAVYLPQLQAVGFTIPKTAYIKDFTAFAGVDEFASELSRLARTVSESSTKLTVVIKPSISSSAKQTYLMHDPSCMSSADMKYLSDVYHTGTTGSLMIQAYDPGIANGEYSFIYLVNSFRFAIHKVPLKGEFRCQPELGGSTTKVSLNSAPKTAMNVAEEVVRYIGMNVGQLTYCRVDGVLRDSGEFVLMEVETIEPDLYLEESEDHEAKEMLYGALMGC